MLDYTGDRIPRKLRDLPASMRPREEMDRVGAANLPDEALLALLLRAGVRGRNVLELARDMLERHGSLQGLARCTVEELERERGIGHVKAQILKAALELGTRLHLEISDQGTRVAGPVDVAALLRTELSRLDCERVWLLRLNSRFHLKGPPVVLSSGVLDASLAHPREIFRHALAVSSAAVILAHNHPSGDPTPSAEDLRLTRQVVEAGRALDVRVLDHVILGTANGPDRPGYLSIRESGLVEF